MANLFGKNCSSNVFGEPPEDKSCDTNRLFLRRNNVLVGGDGDIATQVKLDLTKFKLEGAECGRRKLTLQKLDHGDDLKGLGDDDHLQYVHISIDREISADHLFTGDPEFRGSTLFSGPITLQDLVIDKNESAGVFGQLLLSTGDGVEWTTTATENVYWVSKSGDDENDGLSETTAKLTIESALQLVKSGYLGKLQDAADLILSNKKLIQEESLGFLMTETDLDGFSFPQEANLDVKAQAARKVIHTSLDDIVDNVLSQISSSPGYDNTSNKCERDLRLISRYLAEDVLWGGYQGARKATSAYFDASGDLISSILSGQEKNLTISALGYLNTEINSALDSAQGGSYFGSIKTQVTELVEYVQDALTNNTLSRFPSKLKDNRFLVESYYKRFDIANYAWDQIKTTYSSLSSQAKLLKTELRSVVIAVSEDAVSLGNKSTYECVSYLLSNEELSSTFKEAISGAIPYIEDQMGDLIDNLAGSLQTYNYLETKVSNLLGLASSSLDSQSLSSFPEVDAGVRNKSVKTCSRDIGFFIDAIASDLKNGGNVNSVEFGKAYYDSQSVIYIDGEVDQTLLTLNKAKDLMILAIRAWVENEEGGLFTPTYSFEDIFVKKGLIMEETYPPCADVESTINTYYSIINTILTSGPRYENESAKNLIFSKIDQIINYAWGETVLEYPLLNKTELTCKRDLGFIIEAIAEDVYKSSNTNMLEATLAYFGASQELIIDGVVGEEQASVFAFNKVRDYINDTLLTSSTYSSVREDVTSLVNILTTAVSSNSLNNIPATNTGQWSIQQPTFKATIVLKSGVYEENNPLQLPSNTALVGDDLRSTTIVAKNRVFDLFYVNNGSKISNVTFSNHLYPAFAVAFPRLNGQGTAGIISRSPYIQNCTSKTTTGGGMEVDGEYAQGFRSMVLDSYTQYNQGGIGVEIKNSGYAQLVSLFTINCSKGIYTNSGGQCDLNNSNASFGDYAMVAKGVSEIEFMGEVAEFTKAGSFQVKIKNLGRTKPYNGQVMYFGTQYYELKNIKILDSGSGYTKPPVITIDPPLGPQGTPARGRATIFNGEVDSVIVLRPGRGYTTKTPGVVVQAPPLGGNQAEIEIQMNPIYYTVNTSTNVENGYSVVTLISPITYDLERGTSVPFFKQSKILASSITLEYVGSGPDDKKSLPTNNGTSIQDNEVEMKDGGLVIFTSTDQAGNFRIGDGVIIDQATGTVGGVSFSRGLFSQITPLILALQ
jgi:hypothetical protein